jgi:ferredoxin-type protein NapG
MSDEEKKEDEEETREDEEGDVNRRSFFTEGFRHMLKPLADVVEARIEKVGLPDFDEYERGKGGYHSPSPDEAQFAPLPDRPVLRPPGALDEEQFLQTCMVSGQCVSACPVAAIKVTMDPDPMKEGRPFIDPQGQACVVCEDLSCMKVCPSSALMSIAREDIRMGLAEVDEGFCVRTQGEDCQICVDKCPLGESAITISYFGGPVEVLDPGCTGCGVCEMYCPTEPKAIVVKPLSESVDSEDSPDDGPSPSDEGTYLPMD